MFFQIFDAISPKHEDFEKFVQELYDVQSMLKSDWFHSDWCRGELLPQEFGCYLSHYFLWKECVKTNQPVVILEDDVVLEFNLMHNKTLLLKRNKTLKDYLSLAK
ncbi:hypothetical protein MM0360_03810 [Helicobacter pylori]